MPTLTPEQKKQQAKRKESVGEQREVDRPASAQFPTSSGPEFWAAVQDRLGGFLGQRGISVGPPDPNRELVADLQQTQDQTAKLGKFYDFVRQQAMAAGQAESPKLREKYSQRVQDVAGELGVDPESLPFDRMVRLAAKGSELKDPFAVDFYEPEDEETKEMYELAREITTPQGQSEIPSLLMDHDGELKEDDALPKLMKFYKSATPEQREKFKGVLAGVAQSTVAPVQEGKASRGFMRGVVRMAENIGRTATDWFGSDEEFADAAKFATNVKDIVRSGHTIEPSAHGKAGVLERGWLQTAEMAPSVLTSMGLTAGAGGIVGGAGRLAAGARGAATGAGITAATGAEKLRKGGRVASRIAGAGKAAGKTFGKWAAISAPSTAFWGSQEYPGLKDQLVAAGMDEDSAANAAAIGATMIGAIEQIKPYQGIPGPKLAAARGLHNRIANYLIQSGANFGEEWFEEAGQAAVEYATKKVAAEMGGEFDWEKEQEQAIDQFVQAAIPLAIMQAPGFAMRGPGQVARGVKESVAIPKIKARQRLLRTLDPKVRKDLRSGDPKKTEEAWGKLPEDVKDALKSGKPAMANAVANKYQEDRQPTTSMESEEALKQEPAWQEWMEGEPEQEPLSDRQKKVLRGQLSSLLTPYMDQKQVPEDVLKEADDIAKQLGADAKGVVSRLRAGKKQKQAPKPEQKFDETSKKFGAKKAEAGFKQGIEGRPAQAKQAKQKTIGRKAPTAKLTPTEAGRADDAAFEEYLDNRLQEHNKFLISDGDRGDPEGIYQADSAIEERYFSGKGDEQKGIRKRKELAAKASEFLEQNRSVLSEQEVKDLEATIERMRAGDAPDAGGGIVGQRTQEEAPKPKQKFDETSKKIGLKKAETGIKGKPAQAKVKAPEEKGEPVPIEEGILRVAEQAGDRDTVSERKTVEDKLDRLGKAADFQLDQFMDASSESHIPGVHNEHLRRLAQIAEKVRKERKRSPKGVSLAKMQGFSESIRALQERTQVLVDRLKDAGETDIARFYEQQALPLYEQVRQYYGIPEQGAPSEKTIGQKKQEAVRAEEEAPKTPGPRLAPVQVELMPESEKPQPPSTSITGKSIGRKKGQEAVRKQVATPENAVETYDYLKKYIRGQFKNWTGDRDAEDLVNETLSKALEKSDQFEPGATEEETKKKFRGWLKSIANSTYNDWARRAKRQQRGGEEQATTEGETTDLSSGQQYNALYDLDVETLQQQYRQEFPRRKKIPSTKTELIDGDKRRSGLWSAAQAPGQEQAQPQKIDETSKLQSHYAEQLRQGKKYQNINEARKEAEDALGPVKPGTKEAKQVDEIMEQAVVREAQRIAQDQELTDEQKFNELKQLYDRHPKLGTRTGKQMRNQAFSTPAPLAWLTNVMADVQPGDTVYDSSAGNGMLLIGAENAIANELDPDRAQAINADQVTTRDATEYRPDGPVDKVIINPPFGTVTKDGQKQTWTVEGVKTDQVDHAIAMNSLPAMKDDGRAVLILGARGTEQGQPKADQPRAQAYVSRKPFYDHLYNNYNVVEHFTVDGDLYAKQGAGFPVDVIVIDGKGQSSRPKPYNFKEGGLPQFYNSWEDLRDDKLKRDLLDTGGQPVAGDQGVRRGEGGRGDVEDRGGEYPGRPSEEGGKPGGGVGGRVGDAGGRSTTRTGEGGRTARTSGVSERAGEARDDTARDRQEDVEEEGPTAKPEDVGPAATRADQGLSQEERSDAERMMDEALERELGLKPVGEPKEAPQKKAIGKKKSPRKAKTEAKKQQAQEQLEDTWKKFMDVFRDELDTNLGVGLSPKKVAVTAELVRDAVRAGVASFEDFVASVADRIGRDNTLKLSDYIELAWNRLRSHEEFQSLDSAGGVEDILTEKFDETSKKEEQASEHQAAYQPTASGKNIGTLVPKTQASAVERALAEIEAEQGDLREFVAREVGPRVNMDGLAAEQVDAVALAIVAHKTGKAFINGDMTGVGKGRTGAVMMEYAKRQGLVPVFVTQDSSLFGDMMRDLGDVGLNPDEDQFNFLATNPLCKQSDKDSTLILPDGREIKQTPDTATKRLNEAMESFRAGKGLQAKKTTYDAVFTTYSQLQPVNQSLGKPRHFAMREIAPQAFFILDESHNAGGSGERAETNEADQQLTRAAFIRDLVSRAAGNMFMSATYAKRPSVMDLYGRTGMTDAVKKPSDLGDAIAAGGVPLQQAVSEMLVDAGVFLRRERSYEGVPFEPQAVDVGLENADAVSSIFRQIELFDRARRDAEQEIEGDVVSAGGQATKDEATGRAALVSTKFSSLLWNMVDQMLLGLKAESAARQAIQSWQEGEAPIIAVNNTLQAALKHYLDANPAEFGDEISFTFNEFLKRYLERSRRMTVKSDALMPSSAFGDGELIKVARDKHGNYLHYVRLSDRQLGPEAMELYNQSLEMIESFGADVPASPIDRMRKVMEDAGMRVAEVTGRAMRVEYTDDGKMYLGQRSQDETGQAGKRATVQAFNQGEMDAIILNRSGATGLSLHASEKNPEPGQRRRHMIIAQAATNIDEFMQVLGRVHRTGQVNPPRYTLFMSNAPAETRPASVLVKKLASLNANVTASASGDVSFDAPDLLNVVGNRIVADYMADRPELNAALGHPVTVSYKTGEPKVKSTTAKDVTGLMAIMPVQDQQQFWDDITASFNQEIEELNRLHKNPLQASSIPFEATTLDSLEIFEGDPDSSSPFKQPAQLETVRVKRLGEPMKPQEVTDAVDQYYGGKSAGEWFKGQKAEVRKSLEEQYKKRSQRLAKDEAKQNLRENMDQKASAVEDALQVVPPGSVVDVQEGGMYSTTGVVIDLKARNAAKSITPSGWTVEIALASPERIIRVPLSRITSPVEEQQQAEVQVIPERRWSTEEDLQAFEDPGDAHEVRNIATGNILAAYSTLQDENGSVVFYTDNEGKEHRGVLLPRKFNLRKWEQKQPVVFKSSKHLLDYLRQGGRGVGSPNFDMTLTEMDADGNVTLSIPTNKQKNRKYVTSEALRKAAGKEDFTTRGKRMVMTVPADRLEATFDALLELTNLQTGTEDGKTLARNLDPSQQVDEAAVTPPPKTIGRKKIDETSKKQTQEEREREILGIDESRSGGDIRRFQQLARQQSTADWWASDPVTTTGKKLVKKLQRQKYVGIPTILGTLLDYMNTIPLIGKSQLSQQTPEKHYRGPRVIRTNSGQAYYDWHGAGHALSRSMEIYNPDWMRQLEDDLIALTFRKGTMASGNTAEEGMAEFVRRYVQDHKSLPMDLVTDIEDKIWEVNPELLGMLQDTHRAFAYHMSRPMEERETANDKDKYYEGLGKRSPSVNKSLQSLTKTIFGPETTFHWIYSRIGRPLVRHSLEAYYEFQRRITDTPADLFNAHSNTLRIPIETNRALMGEKRGPQGVRAAAYGDQMLSKEQIKTLRDAGLPVPDMVRHGEWLYFTDESFADIKEDAGDRWEKLELYGLYRASLERMKKKGHMAPWLLRGVTPQQAQEFIERMERENADFTSLFDRVTNYFDGLLMVAVLNGEHTVDEAVKIKGAWESYWPLHRDVEGKDVSGGGASENDISSGILRAFGSALPFQSIVESAEFRTKHTMQSYYQNCLRKAVRDYSRLAGAFQGMPEEAKIEARRLMLPLKMDQKVAAHVSPREQERWVADAVAESMNQALSDYHGRELQPDERYSAEDVNLSLPWRTVWRGTKPNLTQVVGVFENGQIKFYQVLDSTLYDVLSMSHELQAPTTWMEKGFQISADVMRPWKNVITGSLRFAWRNLFRDMLTGLAMGEGIKSLIPGRYVAAGIRGRLSGKTAKDPPPLLYQYSATLEDLEEPAHREKTETFLHQLWQETSTGQIWGQWWQDMNGWERARAAPGQISATLAAPANFINFFGGRQASQFTEALGREGAYLIAREEGMSATAAARRASEITGKFEHRQGDPTAQRLFRQAAFLNPTLQILWGQARRATDPDPRVRKLFWMWKMPMLSVYGAIGAALNVYVASLLSKMWAGEDDDDDWLLKLMQEQPAYERRTHASVMGILRMPFEGGVPGAVTSTTWNVTQDLMLDGTTDPGTLAKDFLRNSFDMVPGLHVLLEPHLKSLIEVNLGRAGYSWYRDETIVPMHHLVYYPRDKQEHVHSWTPDFYKWMNTATGIEPLKIEYWMRNNLGSSITNGIDIVDKLGKGQLEIHDWPVLRGILQRPATGYRSKSVQALRDASVKFEDLAHDLDKVEDPEDRKKIEQEIAKVHKAHIAHEANEKLWSAARDEMKQDEPDLDKVKEIHREMMRQARGAVNYINGRRAEPPRLYSEAEHEWLGKKVYDITSPSNEDGAGPLNALDYSYGEAVRALSDYWRQRFKVVFPFKSESYKKRLGRLRFLLDTGSGNE